MSEAEQLDHIQRGLIATWQLWMQWFVWFYGAQVVLLWARPGLFDQHASLVANLWIAFSLSGALTAIMVARYTWLVGIEYPDIGFPTTEATIGALLNAFPLIATVALWRKVKQCNTTTDLTDS